jgi:hypothetical protein
LGDAPWLAASEERTISTSLVQRERRERRNLIPSRVIANIALGKNERGVEVREVM